MVRAWNGTPLEPGKNLSVAALMSVLIVVMSATLKLDAWCESWEYLSVATLLALGIVERTSTGHSSKTGNVSRYHPRRTTLLKPWIIANPTTLRWESIARHVFGNDTAMTARLDKRVDDPFTAATARALAHAIWALTQGEIRSWSKPRPSFR